MPEVATLARSSEPVAVGRVLQVNVSPGGVPKLPVGRAWVGRLGLEGDAHREDTVHGGPHRAVCLFGIEAIERLQAEGHPVEPGSVGENLTTSGVEWSTLPVGTRARVGESLLLELASAAGPCSTQRPNFIGGRFGRISIKTHPADSRMYARVLAEGAVRSGDDIVVLPAPPNSEARVHALLDRIDDVERESYLRLWRAARAAGYDVRIVDDGELAIGASPVIVGATFNQVCGLRTLPHKLPRALEMFRSTGTAGWLPMFEPPWEHAQPDFRSSIVAAAPADVPDAPAPTGVAIRAVGDDGWQAWAEVLRGSRGTVGAGWLASLRHLTATRGVDVLVAELDGSPVGVGTLHVHHHAGFLRGAEVIGPARGRGIHRALIAARVRLAADRGCDLVALEADPGSASERNALAMGFAQVVVRDAYRFDPSRRGT